MGALSPQLELPPEILVGLERAPLRLGTQTKAVESTELVAARPVDLVAATIEALQAPLNYPPLADGIVPGDTVAIAVDEAVPHAVDIVRGAIVAAEQAGVERHAISVVANDEALVEAFKAELGNGAGGPQFVLHDPDDDQELCLVARTGTDAQLYVNRALFEADVVLPIGCARLDGVAGSGGVYDSLFPRFCDAATIARLRTPSQFVSATRRSAARRQIDEAGWLFGVQLVIQVVPGSGGSVAEIVAGESQAVAEKVQQLCQRLWAFRAPRRASLVIASVTGGRLEQTWDNIARALAATESLVDEGGAVAICSDLDRPVGHSLGRLMGNDDWAAVERDARNDHSDDSWPAWQLARALQRGPVYFLSQLEDDTVEAMGLAPVNGLEELERLAGRQESCIVLDDSQYAVATVAGEES
jgi:hypothetical protein